MMWKLTWFVWGITATLVCVGIGIKRCVFKRPYWVVRRERAGATEYLRFDPYDIFVWTTDLTKALHLARRDDAELVCQEYGEPYCQIIRLWT